MSLQGLRDSIQRALGGVKTDDPRLKEILAQVQELARQSGAARTYARDELRTIRSKLANYRAVEGVTRLLESMSDLELQMSRDLTLERGLGR
jgi:hypothetical protein